jgi:hypothetical protein
MTQWQHKPWSQQEDSDLRVAALRGATLNDLTRDHQRSTVDIRVRLEHLGLPDASDDQPAAEPSTATQALPSPASSLERSINDLMVTLLKLKATPDQRELPQDVVRDVTKAYERLNAGLLETAPPTDSEDTDAAGQDPPLDRLRAALLQAVSACLSNLENRYIANLALGLIEDGEQTPLAAIAGKLGVSREQAHQRCVHAFLSINVLFPQASPIAVQIHSALKEISATTHWADPLEAAPHVVRLINDSYGAATQLTLMCCRAAGASSRDLAQTTARAVTLACRDPDLHGCWTLGRWADAVGKTLFERLSYFPSPPIELRGTGRLPGNSSGNSSEPDTLHFKSNKLNRTVACESWMERQILSWLERSPDVLWYQEQPAAVPCVLDGEKCDYFPGVAIWDSQHRVVIVEAKPIFRIFRRETLIRALAALGLFGSQGMGYLLIDTVGRTLAELAHQPFDVSAAEEIESLFAKEPLPFRAALEVLKRRTQRFDWAAFASMVVNRDWAVSGRSPVEICRLPKGVSFRPLLRAVEVSGAGDTLSRGRGASDPRRATALFASRRYTPPPPAAAPINTA